MGGAQPLAVTMNEGIALVVEVDPARAKRRLETRYLDELTDSLEDAMTRVEDALKKHEAKSIGLLGNAADVLPELVTRGVVPDVVTDQTPAHDPLSYVPEMPLEQAERIARLRTQQNTKRNRWTAMARHVQAMLEFQIARRNRF